MNDAGSRTLIGRIMTKRNLNKATVRSMILKAWNVRKEVKIVEGDNGSLLFSFEDCEEYARVLRIRPWIILGFLLMIQERLSFEPIAEVQWRMSPYWIQIHGIFIEGFTDDNILKIGSRIGEVLEFERPIVNNVVVRSFLRIKILVYIDAMLIEGF